jgi:hypothetical protein
MVLILSPCRPWCRRPARVGPGFLSRDIRVPFTGSQFTMDDSKTFREQLAIQYPTLFFFFFFFLNPNLYPVRVRHRHRGGHVASTLYA